MDQKTIKGQAFRVLTDAVNGVFHRISFWTHADDVEMTNGNTLTEDMNNKYNVDSDGTQVLATLNDIPDNTFGYFTVDMDVLTISVDGVRLSAGNRYMFFSYKSSVYDHKMVFVVDTRTLTQSGEEDGTPLYILRLLPGYGWKANIMSSSAELNRLQQILEAEIAQLDRTKLGYVRNRLSLTSSLDDVPMNSSGTVIVTQKKAIGYHDDTANITTYILPGEYTYFSIENDRQHKSILLLSNTKSEETNLLLGGGYYCTNTGMTGAPWIITRILSPTDFSTDETGLREQIVASLTGQLWPVGAIYLNLTRENPGNFLGGTWNLITEGILTAIKGSPEQSGYHQRDLYKAVRDEDRGEHLYGVFAWQRIA